MIAIKYYPINESNKHCSRPASRHNRLLCGDCPLNIRIDRKTFDENIAKRRVPYRLIISQVSCIIIHCHPHSLLEKIDDNFCCYCRSLLPSQVSPKSTLNEDGCQILSFPQLPLEISFPAHRLISLNLFKARRANISFGSMLSSVAL